MVDSIANFKDAQRLIKENRPKEACGILRPILEEHLKRLCVKKKIVLPSTNMSEMISALSKEQAISNLERNRFMTWKNLGNAGAHAGNEKIQLYDAQYFLSGLADSVKVKLDKNTQPLKKPQIKQTGPAVKKNKSTPANDRKDLISAFYLSKFEHDNLRLGNQAETITIIAEILSVNRYTLKNYRDYYDSFTPSPRAGSKRKLPDQLNDIFQKFNGYEELRLRKMVLGFIRKK